MKREIFLKELRRLLPEPSEETLQKLFLYADLLREVAYPLGLSNFATEEDILEKHLLDSLELLPHLPEGALCDLGSGAGLPGIPLKIVRPELEIWLVDRRRKAVSFLEYAVARLGLKGVNILQASAESPNLPRNYFAAVCARAVTSLADLWRLAEPLLKPGGKLLALKGPRGVNEKEALAREHPTLKMEAHPYTLPCGRPGIVVVVLKG